MHGDLRIYCERELLLESTDSGETAERGCLQGCNDSRLEGKNVQVVSVAQ